MSRPRSFRDVISLWPTHVAMAGDTGAPVAAVPKWSQRDRIPPEYWPSIVRTRVARKACVTVDMLAGFSARELRGKNRLGEVRA